MLIFSCTHAFVHTGFLESNDDFKEDYLLEILSICKHVCLYVLYMPVYIFIFVSDTEYELFTMLRQYETEKQAKTFA